LSNQNFINIESDLETGVKQLTPASSSFNAPKKGMAQHDKVDIISKEIIRELSFVMGVNVTPYLVKFVNGNPYAYRIGSNVFKK
jgi:hypothetical protein